LVHNLETRGQGRLPDGTILAATSVQRLFCDAGLHRVFTTGRSSILDYGTTTRTVPAPLYNALRNVEGHWTVFAFDDCELVTRQDPSFPEELCHSSP
jgi:hypothetical protein